MSTLLIDFFEEEFLPVQDLTKFQVKRYRNAIGRASQLLDKPIEYIDASQPGFQNWFIENLLRLGFTVHRSEEFAVCIRKVSQAMRESRRATPRPEPSIIEKGLTWISDHQRTIALLFEGDSVCVGQLHNVEAAHEHGESTI